MSRVSKRVIVLHSIIAGSVFVAAGTALAILHGVRKQMIPEYSQAFRLFAGALMLAAALWVAVGWLSFMLDIQSGDAAPAPRGKS
ncbi:MAG: hypothetical protein JXR37_12145 [Kiritimatiellae bacterium]|nr:hypothetical protein [Kiritimatiellia bacterium]